MELHVLMRTFVDESEEIVLGVYDTENIKEAIAIAEEIYNPREIRVDHFDLNNMDTIEEKFFDAVISDLFRRCNTCFKMIDKKEPYVVAYKNGHPAYFCRDHIHDAEHYLDWFQELVDIRRCNYDADSRD